MQVNVPRHLPFKIGKIKEAACGGTGNIVLTGELIFLQPSSSMQGHAVGGL